MGVSTLHHRTQASTSHCPTLPPSGWIAVFGAVTLIVLADVQDIETVLEKVEWGTLVFFAALFVLMELLAELGLIRFIASTIVYIIEVGVLKSCNLY